MESFFHLYCLTNPAQLYNADSQAESTFCGTCTLACFLHELPYCGVWNAFCTDCFILACFLHGLLYLGMLLTWTAFLWHEFLWTASSWHTFYKFFYWLLYGVPTLACFLHGQLYLGYFFMEPPLPWHAFYMDCLFSWSASSWHNVGIDCFTLGCFLHGSCLTLACFFMEPALPWEAF
jgi:hypothetical protein